jgi:glycogen debranching enzyme
MTRITQGAPEPLGLTLTETGANVAVFSASARAIDLCLFDEAGEVEVERLRIGHRTGDVFYAHVEGLREGRRYGLRAHGAYEPEKGLRFNASKLLVDPYALKLDRPFALHPSMFGYKADDAAANLSFDRSDSAPFAPKGVAMRPSRADTSSRPRHRWEDTILYELHVKGFTKTHPQVPEALRGTFRGLAHEAAIAHLTRLGVTAVELMPCAAWIDERHLIGLGLSNYWGYNPIAMMAPDPRLAPGGWDEVREAVAALHRAGIEVILDVVFNHTGEGDELGPTLSLRGLDNTTYYRLRPDAPRHYVNDSGCGNILAMDRAPVARLALDALRAWAEFGGVDGFRFDLATTLARRIEGFDAHAPFLAALLQDPVLRELKLIAEPWDIGPGGYQLGRFPGPFAEWNDRFRDCVRRFWRGDVIGVGELATRVAGSRDFFEAHRRPARSINFVTAHDGFTLRDLVSYSHKRNDANGEDNRDGTNENFSWNNGAEGETDDDAILAARGRDQRNLLASLLLARGTPMLSMGAELGQTQAGNNNAYAQDNETAWLDWRAADRELLAFARELIALRKDSPALTRDSFLAGAPLDETLIPDIEWRRANGALMREEDWRDGSAATLLACLYAPTEGARAADRIAIIWHRGADAATVAPPPPRDGFDWTIRLATAPAELDPKGVAIAARSVVVLREQAAVQARRFDREAPPELVFALAQAAGVAPSWRDVDGAEHQVPRETIEALLAALHLPANGLSQARDSLAVLARREDSRALPMSAAFRDDEDIFLRLPARDGRAAMRLELALEDGERRGVDLRAGDLEPIFWRGVDGRVHEGLRARLPRLALGRHIVSLEGTDCRLIVAPRRCHAPRIDGRAFGLAAQLYSLRRDGDQGVGDFTTLSQLGALAARHGAAIVAINPLHALFAGDRERASPYYPSDRRFLDPIYLDIVRGKDFFNAPNAERLVDYPAVHAEKQRFLEGAFKGVEDFAKAQPGARTAQDFESFLADGGDALFRFACFETISERRGFEDWRRWPGPLRDGEPRALADFARENASRIRYHQYLQQLCESQFARAAREAANAGLSLGFCRDLAVGAAPDGCESWRGAAHLLRGFAIGAPPDSFTREGQNWGLPPPDPLRWKADGCESFGELLRANMRHAGALRIDHVMGLARLFVVPEGGKPLEGAYLSYPLDDLLARLALESNRAQCAVIGEDLGTLPWGFSGQLADNGILSYRVLWFEREGGRFAPPAHYAPMAMTCVSTHDLPTLKGWWEGADIAEKLELGLLSEEDARKERERRREDRRLLLDALAREGLLAEGVSPDAPFSDALAGAAHAYVARAPALLAMAQVDDLAGESIAVNLPGTDRERPNWRRKLDAKTADLFETGLAQAILSGLRRNLD